jgi:hypothetical protein
MRCALQIELLAIMLVAVAACDGSDDVPNDASTAPALPRSSASAKKPLPVPTDPEPAALERLLQKVPKDVPPPSGSAGTLVGTNTGIDGHTEVVTSKRPRGEAAVRAGPIEVQPLLSSPAIERAAREQIYWNLRKCTGPDGKAPPPESITLRFTIDSDGSVDPASVSTHAATPELEPTAECVLSAFSASPFRGPAATRKTSARVIITWPSVD